MPFHQSHALPVYAEQALGYVWDTPVAQWLAVYQDIKGKVIWSDGMAWDTLPEGLFPILERLWGRLPQEHAYLLDLEARGVDIIAITALDAVLQDVGTRQRFESWRLEAIEARRVSQMLVAYGERLIRRALQQECQECFHGFLWLPVATQFVPCIFCNPTGE